MSIVRIPKVSYGLKTGVMPEGKLFSSLFITEGILVLCICSDFFEI